MKRVTALLNFLFFINIAFAADRFVVFQQSPDYFPVISNGVPCSILTDSNEEKGIQMAIKNLQKDIAQVSGNRPEILNISNGDRQTIIIGSNESPFIKALFKTGKLEKEELNGKKEKYIMLRNSIKEDLKENFISEEEYWQYNKEYSDKIKKIKEDIQLYEEEKETIKNNDTDWMNIFKKKEKINELNRLLIDELIEDIVVSEDGNIKVIFKYEDKYFEALDFINKQKYDIILSS